MTKASRTVSRKFVRKMDKILSKKFQTKSLKALSTAMQRRATTLENRPRRELAA
jgi:hypothetical protein